MIVIFGTLMQNDNISGLFFLVLILWAQKWGKRAKMAQNGQKAC